MNFYEANSLTGSHKCPTKDFPDRDWRAQAQQPCNTSALNVFSGFLLVVVVVVVVICLFVFAHREIFAPPPPPKKKKVKNL